APGRERRLSGAAGRGSEGGRRRDARRRPPNGWTALPAGDPALRRRTRATTDGRAESGAGPSGCGAAAGGGAPQSRRKEWWLMFYEAGRLVPEWFLLVPLAQQSLTLNLSGVALLVIFMGLGAYWGYNQGLRNILTPALWTIIAYILTVQGGTFIVDLINRFWQNGPALVAFALGQDPGTAPTLDPLITPGFQIPLFFRFLTFVALVLLG